MGGGTGTTQHEEPAVETEASLTGDLEVDLDPEDVWTLGQLLEAGAVSLPPRVAEELTTGYRILQASGYEPPEDAETDVDLRGSGEATGIELPVDGDEPTELEARRVILAEIATEETEPSPEGEAVEPGVDVQPRSAEPEAADAEQRGPPRAAAPAVDRQHTQRLAEAIDELADAVEEVARHDDRSQARRASLAGTMGVQDGLVLDWALIGIGLGVSTMLVLASGVVADPVFAILGIALLVLCVFQAVPYLVEDADQEGLR
jgi:hypothetical protein